MKNLKPQQIPFIINTVLLFLTPVLSILLWGSIIYIGLPHKSRTLITFFISNVFNQELIPFCIFTFLIYLVSSIALILYEKHKNISKALLCANIINITIASIPYIKTLSNNKKVIVLGFPIEFFRFRYSNYPIEMVRKMGEWIYFDFLNSLLNVLILAFCFYLIIRIIRLLKLNTSKIISYLAKISIYTKVVFPYILFMFLSCVLAIVDLKYPISPAINKLEIEKSASESISTKSPAPGVPDNLKQIDKYRAIEFVQIYLKKAAKKDFDFLKKNTLNLNYNESNHKKFSLEGFELRYKKDSSNFTCNNLTCTVPVEMEFKLTSGLHVIFPYGGIPLSLNKGRLKVDNFVGLDDPSGKTIFTENWINKVKNINQNVTKAKKDYLYYNRTLDVTVKIPNGWKLIWPKYNIITIYKDNVAWELVMKPQYTGGGFGFFFDGFSTSKCNIDESRALRFMDEIYQRRSIYVKSKSPNLNLEKDKCYWNGSMLYKNGEFLGTFGDWNIIYKYYFLDYTTLMHKRIQKGQIKPYPKPNKNYINEMDQMTESVTKGRKL